MATQSAQEVKRARIQFRVRKELKDRIESVAATRGLSITEYVLAVVSEKVDEDLASQSEVFLSQKDRKAFFEMLEERKALPEAWERAKKRAEEMGE